MMKTLLYIFLMMVFTTVYGSTVSDSIIVREFPSNYQLYPKISKDSSTVKVKISTECVESHTIKLIVLKNGELQSEYSEEIFENKHHEIQFGAAISAELSEYSFLLYCDENLIDRADSVVAGDVYIIAGQSNAVAYDYENKSYQKNEFIRSYGTMLFDSTACVNESEWGVATSFGSAKHLQIGVWGMKLASGIVDSIGIPVCIINGGVSSSPIEWHQRNNSNPTDLSSIYGRILYRATKSKVAESVKGLIWWQGEANEPEGYAESFDTLYNSWEKDYPGIERYYVIQLQQGCGSWNMTELCEVQRSIANSYDDIGLMVSAGINDRDADHCHYGYDGYIEMGQRMYRLLANDLYNMKYEFSSPPMILEAKLDPFNSNIVSLYFDQDISISDQDAKVLKDYIYIDGMWGSVKNVTAIKNELRILTERGTRVNTVSYTPSRYYHERAEYYTGPWVTNTGNLPIVIFHNFRIDDEMLTDSIVESPFDYSLHQNYPNPFNPKTTLSFSLKERSKIVLEVFNVNGQMVERVTDSHFEPGTYSYRWYDDDLSSGVYIYRIRANSLESKKVFSDSKMMMKLK